MPLTSSNIPIFNDDELTQALAEANPTFKSVPEDIKDILDYKGASKEEAARVIAEVMKDPGKFGAIQLKAAETVLDLHEVRDKNGRINSQPVINFIIKSDKVQINQCFAPHRLRSSDSST